MSDLSKSFSVDDGVSFGNDDVGIVYGTNDPSVSGQVAPVGSLYLRVQTADTYLKIGAADTEWRKISMTPRRAMSYSALRV